MLVGALLTALAVYYQHKYISHQRDSKLTLLATDEAAHIKERLNKIIEIMESIRNFYAASKFVDRDEFQRFVNDQVAIHPEVRALEWVPLVREKDRLATEDALARVFPGRRITELDAEGNLVPATSRAHYFPVFYVEPLQGNETALGYDLGSNSVRVHALQRAWRTGKIAFSDKIQLVQGSGSLNGVLLLQPVYRNETAIETTEDRQSNLLGFAVGVIDTSELITSSIRNYHPTGLDILLANQNENDRIETLHFHASLTRDKKIVEPPLDEFLASQHEKISLKLPDAEWDLYFRPTPSFFLEYNSQQVLIILLAGIVLTSLLALNVTKHIHYTHDVLHQANHDALTGLPNRILFKRRLNQAVLHPDTSAETSAVLFLDLDNFKHINDSLGHAVGDLLLIEVATRLRENTRIEDTIARMGGDEFILLVQHLRHEQDITHLAKKILLDLTSPYKIGDRVFYLSASIGISLFPRDATNAEALIANADAAMYRAKSKGRNTFDFYSTDLTTISTQRMQLELELREVVKHSLLDIHYQPQIDFASGKVIGAEALARWMHPEQGAISPQLFIPVAEDSGLIVEIGEWILLRACQQAKSWLDSGMDTFSMAVNVSGIQLQRSDFVATVKKVLNETGLAAQHLELELTESVIMAQADKAIDTLIELGKLGVSLAIDDFGTGHSSLAYLKRLPLDKLKIDRSFIHDLPEDEEDVAITSAIIALSNSLGLRVTAEGVETRSQYDFLKRLGCNEAQGYYFGRPVPPEEFPLSKVELSGQQQTENHK